MLKVGQEAPDIEGLSVSGETVRLSSLWEKETLVLFFYPKDFTPVCTKEACLFRDSHAELAEQGVLVVGVSGDSPESHTRFASEHALPYPLLSDPERKIAQAYDLVRPLGLGVQRVTYVISKDGVIRGVLHHELRAGKHLEGVRKVLRESRELSEVRS